MTAPRLERVVRQTLDDRFASSADLAAAIVAAVLEKLRESRTITTADELDALPPESIIKTEGGSVACRFYDGVHGVVFGDDRPFKWHALASELPGVLLWHPDWAEERR